MRSRISKIFMAALAVFALAAFPNDSFAGDWEFVVAPYIMLPNIKGDTSAGRISDVDLDIDTGDILDALDLGGMLQLEARHENGVGFVVNYAFMELSDDSSGPLGFTSIDAEIFQGILESYGTYRIDINEGFVDVYAGVRWWDLALDIDGRTPTGMSSASKNEDWVDPIVGARVSKGISDKWNFVLQSDIGGFSIASDFTWAAKGGFVWNKSESFSLALLYQDIGVDYSTGTKGTSNHFAYDTITHGTVIGTVFRF